MTSHDNSIDTLPNEILLSIISPFSTQELLSIAPTNRRIYSLATRLLHQRLVQAAPLPDNKLILECYHPSDQLYTPYLACNYQHTLARDGPPVNEDAPRLADLRRLYASFRPVFAPENRTVRRSRRHSTEAQPSDDVEDDTVTQDVNLDDGELFSQLCAVTNLVKEGPRSGLFISHVNIVDGVVRVFRKWLAEMASRQDTSHSDSENIIWVGKYNNVGIRFSVAPAPSETMPLISGPGDDPPVHYKLVYQELLVRATSLLNAVEQSGVQEIGGSGKTLVIHGAAM
ncbi:f-box protein domain-containing protein [Fusarium heterosporum]|uniref:F-box protein domain-containing protein n=1 Tax=Fusarium heterosporum TaxID=42747 RepID=A0A8H5TMH5_FUSHE|nr:f-box protein domain-containing protein [Fusarium heterosporum]